MTDLDIERLGGLTNLVYRIQCEGRDYLLRIAGAGTEEYIDRQVEEHDARVAARAGVSAEVLFFDAADGLMLADYIPGKTLNAEGFKDLGSVQRSAIALRRMHDYSEPFKHRFAVFDKIDEYLDLLNKLKAQVPEGYDAVKQEADVIRQVLAG